MTMAVPSVDYNTKGTPSETKCQWSTAPPTPCQSDAKKQKRTNSSSPQITTSVSTHYYSAQAHHKQQANQAPTAQHDMNANLNNNKRVGIGVQTGQKKAKGDNTTDMELDAPEETEKTISVEPCTNLADLSKLIPNTKTTNATTPYVTMFGEGKEALHDDLQTLTRHLGQLMCNTKHLNPDQLKRIRQDQIATPEWVLVMQRLISPSKSDAQLISDAQLAESRIIITRIAHTPPKNVLDNIKFEKTIPTLQARIWRAANTLLGSWYHKPQNQVQTKITDQFNNQIQATTTRSTRPSVTIAVNHQGPTRSTGKTTPAKSALKPDLSKQPAKITAKDLPYQRRYSMRFQIPTDKKKPATDHFLYIFRDIFSNIQDIDKTAIIMPWSIEEANTLPAITRERDIPSKLAKFRAYADRARPKAGKMCFFQLMLACSTNPDEFLSKDRSTLRDTWDECEGGAYYCAVQDSDDSIELCYLIYQGSFSDHVRMTEVLRRASILDQQNKTGEPYKLGVRVKKNKDVDVSATKRSDWTMVPNQMATVEVDRDQASKVKHFLYTTLNCKEMGAIGGYNTRVLPVTSQLTSGSQGANNHVNMLRKHQAVVHNLDLIRITSIKQLDLPLPMGEKGTKYTLRQILQALKFPLGNTGATSTEALLHSVDYAADFKNSAKGVVFATAYKDRAEIASKLMSVLPAFISFAYGHDVTAKFCHGIAMAECPNVDWGVSDYSEWDGKWETAEEQQLQIILDDKMGNTDFTIENLDILEPSDTVMHTADNMSFSSYGDALKNKSSPEDEATSGEPDDAALLQESNTAGHLGEGESAM